MTVFYVPGSLWKVRKHELSAFDNNGHTHYLHFGDIFMLLAHQEVFQQDGKDAGEHIQILFKDKTLYVSFIDMGHDIKLYTEDVQKEEKKKTNDLANMIKKFMSGTSSAKELVWKDLSAAVQRRQK